MGKADTTSTTGTDKPKHAGGRPTKLTRELVDKAAKYQGQMAPYELISEVGLAVYLGVSLSSVKHWGTLTTPLALEFSATLGSINTFQHYQALNKALIGEYKAPIAQLVLANHGYVQKQQTDLTTNGKELPAPILGGAANKGGDDD